MCMINDAEPLDFCKTKTRIARKNHECDECKRIITVGEQYTYTAYGMDGDVDSNKCCQHCHSAAQWLNKHCGGWIFFDIKNDLIEHYDSGYREDDLEALVVGIRRKWAAFQGDGLLPIPQIQETAIAS